MKAKPIVFAVRELSVSTLRRYAAIAAYLHEKHGFSIIYFDVHYCGEATLAKSIKEATEYYSVKPIPYQYFRVGEYIEAPKTMEPKEPPEGRQECLTVKYFLEEEFSSAFLQVEKYYRAINEFFKLHTPALVLFDIPTVLSINTLVDVANKHSVNTVSLEHAEGIGDLYSHLPAIAQYYISYGKMNFQNLLKMGVPKERIIHSGSVETDFMHIVNEKGATAPELRSRSLLIALKKNGLPTALQANINLIKQVKEKFPSFTLHVKPHPVDKSLPPMLSGLIEQNDTRISLIDAEEPFSISLERVGLLISYSSYALVESVLMGKKTICISGIQDELYPQWHQFGIHVTESPVTLSEKNLSSYQPSIKQQSATTEYFRYSSDNLNVTRICNALVDIITNDEALFE
ncbi:MAG: hypothetical protein GJ680_20030 [Alteromonadaceae bacterium]|nr:hypothetical protein [Alteromonadaceae bacterium]